jgi:hypothetical protein
MNKKLIGIVVIGLLLGTIFLSGVGVQATDKKDTTPPSIKITKPGNGLYLCNLRISRLSSPLIFGAITVKADVTDDESGVKGVRFSVRTVPLFPQNIMVGYDSAPPYTCKIIERRLGEIKIIVEAFDNAGNVNEVSIVVWKFF